MRASGNAHAAVPLLAASAAHLQGVPVGSICGIDACAAWAARMQHPSPARA